MIIYKIGDATEPISDIDKGIVIVHICNDIGGWGAGFVLALSKKWEKPETEYRQWHKKSKNGLAVFELGMVQFVDIKQNFWVANLIGRKGINFVNDIPPIRYDAVEKGLIQVANFAVQHKSVVHMPRIGCGLAGGKWGEIEKIINETLISQNVDVVVYDLP